MPSDLIPVSVMVGMEIRAGNATNHIYEIHSHDKPGWEMIIDQWLLREKKVLEILIHTGCFV
jgi:hypothetical protein